MTWKLINTFDRPDSEKVDVWMAWGAALSTMGMADSFKLEGGAWRKNGKWYHEHKGAETELRSDYVVMWAPFGDNGDRPDLWHELQERRDCERLKEKFDPSPPSSDQD